MMKITHLTVLWIVISSNSVLAESDLTKPDLATYKSSIAGVIKSHCVHCHGADTQEGDVRLDTINADLVTGKDVSLWKDVLHRIENGEMPPKGEVQPTEKQRDALASWIRGELRKHVTAELGVPGRVVVRRLSRNEYRHTMRDLLGLPYDIGRSLPPDTTYQGFDHVAEVQELSPAQMETYLELARFAVEKTIVAGSRPLSFQYSAEPELGKAGLRWRMVTHGVAENLKLAESIAAKFRIGRGQSRPVPDEWNETYRFAIREGEIESRTETGVWLKAPRKAYNSKGGDWGRIGLRLPYLPESDGVFRLRIKAGARHQKNLGAPILTIHIFKKLLANVEITASADNPQWYEFVFAARDLYDVQIHSDDNRFSKTPVTDIVLNNGYENPGEKKGRSWTVPNHMEIPAVFIDAIEIEANHQTQWPPAQHSRILFESPTRDQPEKYAAEVLDRFMSRAYRRPVTEEELAGKMALFRQAMSEDNDFISAIQEPVVATLVSPQFLFLVEPAEVRDQHRRQLDHYELASRLSYFLWSTMPDDELLTLAREGKLASPEVLQSQVDRMLADNKADAFYRSFTTQWLGLNKLDDLMIEDERWVVRTGLRTSMKEEPVHFFAELVRKDLSLQNLLSSDFAMLNERLAQHYRIPGVYGNSFRRVNLEPEHARGGLLTQAASMTITTDGMITSPIYRGKWVMEVILDRPPPPPPPNVPPLEDAPAMRLSLREQLAKHREDANCAACHQKIDPVGWPFERYSILGEYSEFGWGPNWETFHDPRRNKNGEKPDLHGTLPNGSRVETVRDVQRLLIENHQDDMLRSVTKAMLIYALGRPLDISDDAVIEEIIRILKKKNLGTREMIRAVVLSKPFLEK